MTGLTNGRVAADAVAGPGDELQFDRSEPADTQASPPEGAGSARCTSCTDVLATYYDAGGTPLCARCTAQLEREVAPLRTWLPMLRAAMFGVVAAILGAAVYYGVIAITNFEIGIVAIVIGYMVGWAVRRGARGRGGRRLQVLAVGLTYLSVALAYAPLAMNAATDGESPAPAAVQQAGEPRQAGAPTAAPAADAERAGTEGVAASSDVGAEAGDIGPGGFLTAVGLLLALLLALPVLMVFGSMPSGLISALIIGIGMHQAWKMTGVVAVHITGPYLVGNAGSGSAAAASDEALA